MHNLLFFDHNLIKSDVEVKICCVLFSAKAKILNKKNTQQYFHNNEIWNLEAQVVFLSP